MKECKHHINSVQNPKEFLHLAYAQEAARSNSIPLYNKKKAVRIAQFTENNLLLSPHRGNFVNTVVPEKTTP